MLPPLQAQNRLAVLATYRSLLRATHIAFKDDPTTLTASRAAARDGFRKNRALEAGEHAAKAAVEEAQGVAKILRENVVQGRHMGDDKYKLNIHEHTERGDNDEAKSLKGTTKSLKELKRARF